MHTTRQRPLTRGFARRIRRNMLFTVLVAVLAFCALSLRLVRTNSERFLEEQAQLCAAAIIPGPDGDLSESVDRLQERYERLVAVATLDIMGDIHVVYPQRPAHRAAVQAALKDTGRPVLVSSPLDGEPIRVSGVVVPLNGNRSRSTQKAVMLLITEPFAPEWIQAAKIFALLVGLTALLCFCLMRRWFDRHVSGPLRDTACVVRGRPDRPHDVPKLQPGEWREMTQIAEQFRGLLQDVADSETRARQMELESQHLITKRERGFDRQLRRAKDKATLDALTKLRNRGFLEDELGHIFNRSKAKGADLSVVMIDVDDFKLYNDTKGHQAGDAVLRFVGALLRGGIRPTDHAVRYGGDEFLLLLPDTTAVDAGLIAERLVKLFGQYTSCLGKDPVLSVSAGIASLIGDEPETGADLIAKADAALYKAKRSGKNTVITSQPRPKQSRSGSAAPSIPMR